MSNFIKERAIGGYFSLELPNNASYYHKDAIFYQSARAAFRALIKAKQPKKVYVPRYLCNAMITPLIQEKQNYECYSLDETLNLLDPLELKTGEILLYPNYFGVCQKQVENLLINYPSYQIVLDYSQAFFDPPKPETLATIYSPRKFFGVPDGGLLLTDCRVDQAQDQDEHSLSRMTHLLRRLYEKPENGYADYLCAEESLKDSFPKAISALTHRLMRSIDYSAAQNQRIKNFIYIHSKLCSLNKFVIDETHVIAPLCYPFMTERKGLREYLIKHRVFIPTYWREASERLNHYWIENWIEGLLPLPIDQRYGVEEMDYVISLILCFDDH